MEWWEQDPLSRRFTNLLDKVLSFRAKTGKVTARLAREAGLTEDDGMALATVVNEELTFSVSSDKSNWVSAYDACPSCMDGRGADAWTAYNQLQGENPGTRFGVCVLKTNKGETIARAIVDVENEQWSGQSYGTGSHLLGSVLKFLGVTGSPKWLAGKKVGISEDEVSVNVYGEVTVYVDGVGRQCCFGGKGTKTPKVRLLDKCVRYSTLCNYLVVNVDVDVGGMYRHTTVMVRFVPSFNLSLIGVLTGHIVGYLLDNLEETAGKHVSMSERELKSLLMPGFRQTKFQAALPKLLSK